VHPCGLQASDNFPFSAHRLGRLCIACCLLTLIMLELAIIAYKFARFELSFASLAPLHAAPPVRRSETKKTECCNFKMCYIAAFFNFKIGNEGL
jgi:hypothetical protein